MLIVVTEAALMPCRHLWSKLGLHTSGSNLLQRCHPSPLMCAQILYLLFLACLGPILWHAYVSTSMSSSSAVTVHACTCDIDVSDVR